MRKLIIFLAAGLALRAEAQKAGSLTLQQAYDLSRNNYPVIKQKDLVRQTARLNTDNLQKGYLPQVTLSGQASYQSDVTKVDISVPGFSVEPPSKDQYKMLADINQLIYDGGVIREQKNLQQLHADAEDQQLEVELYKIRDRINQVFLGILFLDQQLRQVELVKTNFDAGVKQMDARVQQGVELRSGLNMLKAERLKTEQRGIELASTRHGLIRVLSLFTGTDIPDSVQLTTPQVNYSPVQAEMTRPEIKLFALQTSLNNQQLKLIDARNHPRASLFAQGGYSRPGLNMLKNSFDTYYIGGIRLNWSLGGLYTRKKEKALVEISRKNIALQQETFELNTRIQLQQQQAEVDKLEKLVQTDKDIIDLRNSVSASALVQLENGVITPFDFIRTVNEADQARQVQITHEIQLLQAQISYQNINGQQ